MKGFLAWSNAWVAVATLGGALLTAVAAASASPDLDAPVLVRTKPDPNAIWLTARLEGALHVRNGCVYLISRHSETPVLAIWPSHYQLLTSDGKTEGVIDTLTGHSVKFGVQTSFGGGEATHVPAAMLDTDIPRTCTGKKSFIYFSTD
jgi:hypothetical protein